MPEAAPRPDLTDIEFETLVALWAYHETHGWAPTMRELGDRIGVRSTGHIAYLLDALERKGYLVRRPDAARAIRLLHDPR